MRITIFGLTLSSSWGNGHATPYRALVRALNRLGHQVTFYEKDVEYYALRRDFGSVPWCDLILYDKWEAVRGHALARAAASEVVINASYCPEGAQINDEVLALKHPLHVFYDLDTPVTLNGLRGKDLDYVRRDQLPAFDLVLSWTGGAALQQLESEFGARMARPLFGCVDPDDYYPMQPDGRFQCALSYMGTYSADRQDKLDALFLEPARRVPEEQFLLAGTLYPWSWQWPQNVRRFDHVSPTDHPALYCSARLTLNLTRAEMAASGYCASGRLFEAAACGAPLVSDSFDGLDTFFTPGEEILVAQNSEDVMAALRRPEHELAQIGRAARSRTLDAHTGMHRAQQMLEYFGEASGAQPPTLNTQPTEHRFGPTVEAA
ncbi:MAG TPA: glycosyltransferase [Candidatus Acidoferrales bacterium]|nr:glycosyltransferase [Candidatus Acidoferrales bacterium]